MGNSSVAGDIYRALRHGGGHDKVTDANVDELITIAKEHGDSQTEYLLREWRSTCGDDPNLPRLTPQLPDPAPKE